MAQTRNAAVLILAFTIFATTAAAAIEPSFLPRRSRAAAYIKASCKSTRYPALCVHCLSTFANNNRTTSHTPQELAQIALTVSLYKAIHTRSYLIKVAKVLKETKAKEYPVVRDCLDQINDSVDQLGESIKELRHLDENSMTGDLYSRISNVETWTSAALTDADTCVDQFPGTRMSKLKATIKVKVTNVAQVTSNALALFNRYAARYRVNAP